MARDISGLRRGGPGRTAGTPNKATVEVRALCQRLLSDREYQNNLRARLTAGDLPPAVEAMLWHYAYGKPKERVEVTGAENGPMRFTLKLDRPDSL